MKAYALDYINAGSSDPAYFIFATNTAMTNWIIAWTGGGGNQSDSTSGTDLFDGNIILQNATASNFVSYSWETNSDSYSNQINGTDGHISFNAQEANYFDAIRFTLEYSGPAFIGFNLNINGAYANSDNIFMGPGLVQLNPYAQELNAQELSGPTVAIAAPAPVPEPATMLLLGTGLAGLIVTRRRQAKN